MNLIQRCKQFANSVKEIRNGGYRYPRDDEIVKELSGLKPRFRRPMRMNFKGLTRKKLKQWRIKRMITKEKLWNAYEKKLDKHLEGLDEGTALSHWIFPTFGWKYKPITKQQARNNAIIEYNKVKFPPPDLDDFIQISTNEIPTPEEQKLEDDQVLEDLEEMLRPMYNFDSKENSGYFLAAPILNFIFIDLLKIAKRPETKRYYVKDYRDYGAYHYPKRTYFKTEEEKSRYSPIHDWSMPVFDYQCLFHSDGSLNFDYQPPPWQLPVPFALGLPHLDDKYYGMRMNDVYNLFGFDEQLINLQDVNYGYRRMWRKNVKLSPYIARIALNARLRAEVNLVGPNPHHTPRPWHDFPFQFAKLKYHFIRLFASNGKRNPHFEPRPSFPTRGCGKMYRR